MQNTAYVAAINQPSALVKDDPGSIELAMNNLNTFTLSDPKLLSKYCIYLDVF